MPWYAVHTRALSERQVNEALRRADFETLWLWKTATIRHAKQEKLIVRSYFPRYLFVTLGLDQSVDKAFKRIPGISTLLHRANGERIRVTDGEMARIRAMGDARGWVDQTEAQIAAKRRRFEAGTRLRITTGAFEGRFGVLDVAVDIDAGKDITLLAEMFGGLIAVTVRAGDVEADHPECHARAIDAAA